VDSACPKELAAKILSDSDHSTKVAPTTLMKDLFLNYGTEKKKQTASE